LVHEDDLAVTSPASYFVQRLNSGPETNFFTIRSKQTIGDYIKEGMSELFHIRPKSSSKIRRYIDYETGKGIQNKRRNRHLVHNVKMSLSTLWRRLLEKLIVAQQVERKISRLL
jgi:hypothetical protein